MSKNLNDHSWLAMIELGADREECTALAADLYCRRAACKKNVLYEVHHIISLVHHHIVWGNCLEDMAHEPFQMIPKISQEILYGNRFSKKSIIFKMRERLFYIFNLI